MVAATGCTTFHKQPIDSNVAPRLKSSTVTQITRPAPSFSAMTAAKVTFGLLGAAAMISEGNKIIASNNVADPADAIAASLRTALTSVHGATTVPSEIRVTSSELADIITATKDSAKFVVDVETVNWSFAYFPTDWSHYRVIYAAKARLIDVEAKAVVAEGFCNRVPESNVGASTYDELLADGAARLKRELMLAADECGQTLKREMLVL